MGKCCDWFRSVPWGDLLRLRAAYHRRYCIRSQAAVDGIRRSTMAPEPGLSHYSSHCGILGESRDLQRLQKRLGHLQRYATGRRC